MSRIARDALVLQEGSGPVLRIQGTGQPAGSDAATGTRPLPAGSERAEGAFGVFGMMISGLIIVFALVLLFLRSRRKR